jgi:hypothetical protein
VAAFQICNEPVVGSRVYNRLPSGVKANCAGCVASAARTVVSWAVAEEAQRRETAKTPETNSFMDKNSVSGSSDRLLSSSPLHFTGRLYAA